MNLYCLYDSKVKEFVTPFFAPSDDHASQVVRNSFAKNSHLVLYPSDYSLYIMASFDETTGDITPDKREILSISHIIPLSLRKYCLDGTFGEESVDDGQET